VSEHPSAHELAAAFLAAGFCSRAERARVVRHLLTGCDTCLTRLRALKRRGQLPPLLRQLRSAGSSLLSGSELDYDRAFASAEKTLSFFVDQGKPIVGPPGELLAELGLPGNGCEEPAPTTRAHQLAIPFLTRWLVEKSHSLRFTDPEEMLHWAIMAQLAAEGCSAQAAGSEMKRADLRAAAKAQLSNALRVLGRAEEAYDLMKSAWRELERGTGDSELRAAVFAKTTSLLTFQRNFQLAIELSLEACATYLQLGMRHHSASVRVVGANAMLYDGDAERASRALQEALPEIDPEEDSSLVLATRVNLVRCYVDLGEPAKALAVHRVWPKIRQRVEPLLLLRMDWQEALLLDKLGDYAAAARMLGQARRGYMDRRLAREAVLATSHLARTLEELGERERAACLFDETAEWIQRMSFGPETSQFFAELQRKSPASA
jgi:tetratricopeptide (TPR) repeat protein